MENNNSMLIVLVIFLSTLLNMWFSYFAIDYKLKQNNIELYGSADNYEKVKLVNKLQQDTIWTLDEVKAQIKEFEEVAKAQGGNMVHEPEAPTNSQLSREELVAVNPIYGNKEAKFSIYEFSDLECPYCRQFHNTGIAKEAVDRNPENLNHIVRAFPLEQLHPGARMKAEALLCLNEISGEESYYKMTDVIFNEVSSTSKNAVLDAVESNGYNRDLVEECLSSGKYSYAVTTELNLGMKMGVTGTPTIMVVNNETGEFKRLNSRSVEAIEELMNTF